MSIARKLALSFQQLYGTQARLFSAPGRVNLIGEHTDYNEGFVLPMAANRRTYVAAALRSDQVIRVHSFNLGESTQFDIDGGEPRVNGWARYVYGLAEVLKTRGYAVQGADVAISSEVPIGAGLSSSAALEISFGFALLRLAGIEVDLLQLALAAQQAEHQFVGTKSGLMDQLTAAFAQQAHALFIDCRSTGMELIPINLPNTSVVVCDTKVKHTLATSAYNQRRDECELAVKKLQQVRPDITSLRDLSVSDLEVLTRLPDNLQRRARHVITENDRTLHASQALRTGDIVKLGRLMNESHQSLRDDYEVSSRELNVMVDVAARQPSFRGGRMMGGGFGGCTVNLVHTDDIELFTRSVTAEYRSETNLEALVYFVEADSGVSELNT